MYGGKLKDCSAWFHAEFPGLEIDELWSILPDTAYFLYHLLLEIKPKTVLEFGSGVSTAVMGKAAASYGGDGYSLEHQEEWLKKTQKICERYEIRNWKIIYAPLVQRSFSGVPEYLIYNPDQIPKKEYDFAFIDGPPGYLPEHPGRRGTLYETWEMLSPNATLLLDDAHRSGEQAAILEWMRVFGEGLSIRYLKLERPAFLIEVDKRKKCCHESIF